MITWEAIEKALTRKNPVQLVKHYDDVPVSTKQKNMQWPAIAQKKEDGVYCMIIRHEGNTRYFSRTGNEFYLEPSIKIGALEYRYHDMDDGCWVTEMVNPACSLEVLSGLVNTNRVKEWDDEELRIMMQVYHVFHDYIPLHDFLQGQSSHPYRDRLNFVYNQFHGKQEFPVQTTVWDEAEWKAFVQRSIDQNWEGAVLKQMHADWLAGHKGWRVMKEVRGIHVDLRCEGVILGVGKFEGLIAGLIFSWKGKRFTAGLGEGWTKEQQEAYTLAWHQDEFSVVNKIWHVYALQESSKGVLRLPKVAELRIDKDEPDDYANR